MLFLVPDEAKKKLPHLFDDLFNSGFGTIAPLQHLFLAKLKELVVGHARLALDSSDLVDKHQARLDGLLVNPVVHLGHVSEQGKLGQDL
jgi:hypothetical protein